MGGGRRRQPARPAGAGARRAGLADHAASRWQTGESDQGCPGKPRKTRQPGAAGDHDYQRVKPPNGDRFVNWLTTHLINALGHTPVARIRARIATYMGKEICRVDIAAHTEPVWAKTSKESRIFFARFNNSTRAVPEDEVSAYLAAHARP